MDAFAFDPRSVWVFAAFMMLANGGVLGLLHHSLTEEIRPSAFYWRLGTLLGAVGCVLQATQDLLPLPLALTISNLGFMACVTCYWAALGLFYGQRLSWWIVLPALFGTIGIYWYVAITPDFASRVILATLTVCALLLGSAHTMHRYGDAEPLASRKLLLWAMWITIAVLVLRIAATLLQPPRATGMLQIRSWVALPFIFNFTAIPIVGTTIFLMMCSERYRLRWEHAAASDYLTGLGNRRAMASVGVRRFAEQSKGSEPFAIVLLDIDHFKRINDQHGHEIGDRALKHVADMLRQHQNPGDAVGRMGGEEFLLMFTCGHLHEAQARAEAMQEALREQPLMLNGVALSIRASFGVALAGNADLDFDHLLRRADEALYRAKANGRDRVELALG